MPNYRDIPEVYEDLGIDISKLGCVMLGVEPFEVTSLVEGGADDLYFSDREKLPTLRFAQGAVAEKTPHLTLKFGLLLLGLDLRMQADRVLEGWNEPSVRISEVSFFPSSVKGEDYSVIVGKVDKTAEIEDGHSRLSLLPHIDTFPGYNPHITLAYIKNGPSGVKWCATAQEKWVSTLNDQFSDRTFAPNGLMYGDD